MKQISDTQRTTRRSGRIGAAAASAGLLVALSACGFNVQTLQPYQPSDGVNINVGDGPNGKPIASTVKVRGLMILAESPTSGFLSATLVSRDNDELTGVTGHVLKPNGAQSDAITVTMPGNVPVGGPSRVVLVDRKPITVKAPRLPAGQIALLTLTFAKAGSENVKVPIIDGNNSVYATVRPSAAPSSPGS